MHHGLTRHDGRHRVTLVETCNEIDRVFRRDCRVGGSAARDQIRRTVARLFVCRWGLMRINRAESAGAWIRRGNEPTFEAEAGSCGRDSLPATRVVLIVGRSQQSVATIEMVS